MMSMKERLIETLLEDLEVLKDRLKQGYCNGCRQETDDTVRLSAEIRRVVSLIAEIDHE
jgi:hypothetical protein